MSGNRSTATAPLAAALLAAEEFGYARGTERGGETVVFRRGTSIWALVSLRYGTDGSDYHGLAAELIRDPAGLDMIGQVASVEVGKRYQMSPSGPIEAIVSCKAIAPDGRWSSLTISADAGYPLFERSAG